MLDDLVVTEAAGGQAVRRSYVVSLFAVFFALGLATASLGASLPAMRLFFHLDVRAGGSLVSAYNLGALAAIIVGGAARRLVSTPTALRVLLVAFIVGTAAMALVPSWTWFYASAPVAGAGYGGLVLYLNSITAHGFGERSFMMLSLVNAMFGLGAIVGPLVGGAITARPQAVFAAASLLALAGQGTISIERAARFPVAGQAPPTEHRAPTRILVAFLVLGFLYEGAETGAGAWEATQLSWLGHSARAAAQLAALFWFGLFVGRVILATPLRNWAPSRTITVCLLASAVAFATAILPDLSLYAYAVAGICLAPAFPAILQWIAGTTKDNQATNSALFTSVMVSNVLLPAAISQVARPSFPASIPIALCAITLLTAGSARILASLSDSATTAIAYKVRPGPRTGPAGAQPGPGNIQAGTAED